MAVARIDLLEVCSQEQKERLVRDVEQVISEAISVPIDRVKIVLVDQTLLVDTSSHTAYVY
ncbi:tautomerase family protein [Pontibacterium sp.]|uniref:tautomerase family protein n=1 Tax=Pontibacterium sp. TaxID=2036026 RepID=UPI003515B357